MADNVVLNSASGGDTVAADDIAGIKHQRVKAEWGPNGTATEVDTGASALPIQDGGNSLTVDDGGSTISVDDGAGSLTVDNAVLSVVGGGTEATAQRVTIATDSTGVLSVDDNGGSLTVDVGTALPAGTNNIGDVDVLTLPALVAGSAEIGRVRLTDGTLTASVRDTGSSDSLNVAIVDASGNQVTSFGGGTQFAEDAASAGGDLMTTAGTVRQDTPTSTTGTDGDYQPLKTDSVGRLHVNGSGVTQPVSDGGGSLTVDDGGSTLSIDDGGGSVTVDGTVAVTGIGTGASDLGKVEDAAAINGDTGVAVLAVRRDSATAGVSADGDYAMLSVDSTGALRVAGGGGGTQYTEDAASTADPVGTALNLVRNDARSGSITSADGDNIAARGTNSGELYVKHVDTVLSRLVDVAGNSCMDEGLNALQVAIVSGGGSGGTAMSDDAAFTVGSTQVTPVAGTYKSTRDGVDDNDAGALAMTQKRGLFVSPETPLGDSMADDTADALKIVGPVASGVTLAGGPLLSGARAGASAPTPVGSDGTAVALRASRQGELMATITDDSGDSCMDNTNNALRVNIVTGAGSGGTAMTDDAAFTVASTSVTPVAGTYRSTRDSVDDGDAGAFAMTQKRAQLAVLETTNGTSMSDESLGALKVSPLYTLKVDDLVATGTIDANGETVFESADGRSVVGIDITGTFSGTLAFEGTVDGSTYFAVSVFDSSGLVISVVAGAVRLWAPVGGLNAFRVRATAWTSGSIVVRLNFSTSPLPFSPLPVSDGGTSLTVDVGTALPAGNNNIGDVDVLTVITGTGATNLGKAEDAAAGSGDTGVAVLAVRRDTAASSSGTDGDYSTLNVNATGRLYTSTTVDAALPAGTNNIGDVDVLSVVPGTGATELGKAEDAAHTSGDVGVMSLAVRKDTPGTGIGADGDYVPLEVDSTGALRVAVTSGGNGSVDGIDAHDAALTADPLTIGGYASSTAPANVTAADATRAWFQLNGAQCVEITAAGARIGGDATNGLDVDVTRMPGTVVEDAASAGAETSVLIAAVRRDAASSGVGADGDFANLSVDSTGALRVTGGGGGTQFAEDLAAVSGDLGTLALAVRRDTAASSSGTDGDYSTLNVNATGRLYTSTTVDAALPAGTNNIGDIDVLTMPGTVTEDAASAGAETMVLIGGVRRDTAASSSGTDGDFSTFNLDSTGRLHANITGTATGPAAHDAAVSGNPVLQGLEARTSDGTAVTNGDVVRPMASTLGKQVVHVGAIPANQIQGNFNETNNTASDVIAAQASGIKIAVMSVTVINKHATVSTTITIRDGTAAKIGPLQCKADGGGFHMTGGGYPLFIGTAATAVTVLAGTTGSDVDIFISGYTTTE